MGLSWSQGERMLRRRNGRATNAACKSALKSSCHGHPHQLGSMQRDLGIPQPFLVCSPLRRLVWRDCRSKDGPVNGTSASVARQMSGAPPLSARFGYASPSGQGRSLGRSTLVIDTGSIHGGRSGDYLRSAANSNAADQAVLFEVAHGFEQTMWVLHRFALLLPQT